MGGVIASVAPTPSDVERSAERSPPTRSTLPKGVMSKKEKEEERLYEIRLIGKKKEFDLRCKNPKFDKDSIKEYTLQGTIPGFDPNALAYMAIHRKKLVESTLKRYSKKSPASMEHCDREKVLLSCLMSDFIVEMHSLIETPNNVYLALNYHQFGSMDRVKRPFAEQKLKLCAAQIVWAIEYLHECGIVYRNLKQRNVLICKDYYIRICNLEESRRVTERMCSFVGPPVIMPPEAHKSKKYTKAVDWWALGILLFEALFGSHPFIDMSWGRDKQIDSILHKEVEFPTETRDGLFPSNEVQEVIGGLLRKKETERFGWPGAMDILWRPWFNDVDDAALYKKKIPIKIEISPIRPEPVPLLEHDEL